MIEVAGEVAVVDEAYFTPDSNRNIRHKLPLASTASLKQLYTAASTTAGTKSGKQEQSSKSFELFETSDKNLTTAEQ